MKRQKPKKKAKKARDEGEDGDEQEDAEDDEDSQDENEDQVTLEMLCFFIKCRSMHPLNNLNYLSRRRTKSLLWCAMRTMRICLSSSKRGGTS